MGSKNPNPNDAQRFEGTETTTGLDLEDALETIASQREETDDE